MFIANDSNYTFGQFLDLETVDIKAPVYSKCFTDTEALKGYRFIHDPEETDPEKCVCFSIYNETSSAALSTPFKEYASVSDLTSVSFRLDTEIVEGHLRDVDYYHVIVPVQNIKEDTLKYLVIMMTKEVELFPENYPYYELVSTFADAEPTSAEAPGGGGGGDSDWTTADVTIQNKVGGTISRITLPNLIIVGGDPVDGTVISTTSGIIAANESATYTVPLYKGKLLFESAYIYVDTWTELIANVVSGDAENIDGAIIISGNCTISLESED